MKIRFVKAAAKWPDNDCYGFVDKEYISGLVAMNAEVDGAEKHNMNYYVLPNGKYVHIYNVFELE